MARALPFHVRHLFSLMQTLGYSQTQCAALLGLSRQAVNNWACGWNVPARYRSALVSLVTLALYRALEPEPPLPPDVLAERTELIDRFVSQWFFETHDARGIHDAPYTALGQQLALTFKTPVSQQGVDQWKAALALHLHAANILRHLIQRHEMASPPAVPLPFRPPGVSPAWWFWFLAQQLEGETLDKSAELRQWEDRKFERWKATLPADKRAGLAAMQAAAAQQQPQPREPCADAATPQGGP